MIDHVIAAQLKARKQAMARAARQNARQRAAATRGHGFHQVTSGTVGRIT